MNWFYLITAVIAYGLATYLLSIVAKNMPIGAVYAFWSAFGITGSLLIDHYVFMEKYNTFQLSGFFLIVAGSVIVNYSRV